ncbi:hypothetical protein GCM10009839_12360 [Catenulispora yoronensis]|uniref:Uncharacterized protein n=1 Tax=Catenulispora yoronensis TaxID=450799 RepID=A0ABP5F676_9ACTN
MIGLADLTERLTADLGAFDVGSAPIGPVMGWGTAMKRRRRAVRAGVLSAVAAAGVALPFALRSQPADVPPPWTNHPVTAHHTVTVDEPQSATNGLPVWSGSVDGVRWTAQPMTSSSGVVMAPGLSLICGTVDFPCLNPNPGQYVPKPAGIEEASYGSDLDTYLIGMESTVTAVDVHLDDGTVLRLLPAAYAGQGLAILRLPRAYPVARVVAHQPSGDQTAIALNVPGHALSWGAWYPDGAVPDVPTASGVIATRTGHDKSYLADKVTAYVGPFGVYLDEGSLSLGPSKPAPHNGLDIRAALDELQLNHSSAWAANEVSTAVDHIVLEYPDGTHEQVTPVVIGGIHFAASFLHLDRPPSRAVSYNAAGGVIAVSDAEHDVGAATDSSSATSATSSSSPTSAAG